MIAMTWPSATTSSMPTRIDLSLPAAGCDGDFHFHRFNEHDIITIPDAASHFNRKRANTPRYFGDNLDFWHSVLRGQRRTNNRDARRAKGDALGFLL